MVRHFSTSGLARLIKGPDAVFSVDVFFFLVLFARFPFETLTYRDLCSPIGLKKLGGTQN